MPSLGAPELIIMLCIFAFFAALGFGLYWLIRKAVSDGKRSNQ